MKIYRIDLYDYEESYDYQFRHPNLVTENQFLLHVGECLRSTVDEVIEKAKWDDYEHDPEVEGPVEVPEEQRKSWIGTTNWFDVAMQKMLSYGYLPLDYVNVHFGASGIIGRSDADRMKNLIDLVGMEDFSKITAHNESLERRMFSDEEVEYPEPTTEQHGEDTTDTVARVEGPEGE